MKTRNIVMLYAVLTLARPLAALAQQGYPPPPGMYPPGCPPYCEGVIMPMPRGPDPPRYLGMPRQPPPDMPIIAPRRAPQQRDLYQEWRCWRFGEC